MKIFYDVDTQRDFMDQSGALYVQNAESIKPNLGRLTEHAKRHGIRVLGSVDRHFGTEEWKPYELELKIWGGPFCYHCMDGSKGQEKIPETHADASVNAIFVENLSPIRKIKSHEDIFPEEKLNGMLRSGKNIIFEKQSYSVFPTEECPGGNELAELFLARLDVREAVVYGVATDYCVRTAVTGMQNRGIQCYVVKDAIEGIDQDTIKSSEEEMLKNGAVFLTTADVLKGGRTA